MQSSQFFEKCQLKTDFFQKIVKMAEYDPDTAETVGDNDIFISIRPCLKFNFTY